jgi:F0F1-type ATP synthase membrane subunit b/b'
MKKLFAALAVGSLLVGGFVFAKEPAQNVSAKKHPNIAAAQKHLADASAKIEAAQKANEYDMEGHAAKAKDLINQASDELKLAAEAANENKK